MKTIIIEKTSKLQIKGYKKENGNITELFISDNVNDVINHVITELYDIAIKRCKGKIEQYYADNGQEYCYIKTTYKYDDHEYIYIISGFRNDWGNYINVYNTLSDNKITISKEIA